MKEKKLKYSFCFSSLALLVIMIWSGIDAGITCDEVLHHDHSVAVYNYFASHGRDQSALNTPETWLRYYGQSYDNIATILAKWTGIEDIYLFRHILSSLAGWLTIIVSALFAVWLTGWREGIIVLILMAVTPAFMGHSQNNLKDIPFALGYISGIWFILRFLLSGRRILVTDLLLLGTSIAFAISIRAGGILLICYLFFFLFLFILYRFNSDDLSERSLVLKRFLLAVCISVASWFAGILLWPYVLQHPVSNLVESYRVMAHFPATFRQLFEGREEWSDFMPWYYLPESMAVTVPVLILAGFILFFVFYKKITSGGSNFSYMILLFTIVFPVLFVIVKRSNLYSSWRQFLFIYPPLVLLASAGIGRLFDVLRFRYSGYFVAVLIFILTLHPVLFMLRNHRYSYLYYNQLTGGLKGAEGRYETDYYYVSQTEASEWLIKYLSERPQNGEVKIKASYSVAWQFRKYPGYMTSYFRFGERSTSDWDYAISVNRYITPYQLSKGIWPPKNTIHTVYADGVPLCAVVERKSKDDYKGYLELEAGHYREAAEYFRKALEADGNDELVYFNFGLALDGSGMRNEADSVLKRGLSVNPGFEPILMYLGNRASADGRYEEAQSWYRRTISVNRKYFEAYVSLAGLLQEKNINEARELLRSCLRINPQYRDAVKALAGTYRKSHPDIAAKYDELAEGMN